jgi:Mrp family chromosome partitioning ATPase
VSTPKRPPGGRFGEQGGRPLPLVTQPLVPFDDGSGTRVDNPMARPEVQAQFSKPTALVAPVASPQSAALRGAVAVPSGPVPQIELTQHHLPTDEHPDGRMELVIDPDSERSAQFRVLRHHLLELGKPQVIVVASPRQGDGKTTVALNLALALAECGRAKVLLADAHVRRPQLANVFRVLPPWCFYEQLAMHRNQPAAPWSFVDIPQLWLHVAPINPRIEKTQLLDAVAFEIAMERLRMGGYDHVVIDAPPVLGTADVNLMADAADAVVLAVRARRSTSRDLRKAVDQLGGNKVVGTVLVE